MFLKSALTSTLVSGALSPALFFEPAFAKNGNEFETKSIDWAEECNFLQNDYLKISSKIREDLEAENWKELKTLSQQADMAFRKGKMLALKKKFPKDKRAEREKAQLLINAVTFDLIAINKGSRLESIETVQSSIEMLDKDVEEFFALLFKLQNASNE